MTNEMVVKNYGKRTPKYVFFMIWESLRKFLAWHWLWLCYFKIVLWENVFSCAVLKPLLFSNSLKNSAKILLIASHCTTVRLIVSYWALLRVRSGLLAGPFRGCVGVPFFYDKSPGYYASNFMFCMAAIGVTFTRRKWIFSRCRCAGHLIIFSEQVSK